MASRAAQKGKADEEEETVRRQAAARTIQRVERQRQGRRDAKRRKFERDLARAERVERESRAMRTAEDMGSLHSAIITTDGCSGELVDGLQHDLSVNRISTRQAVKQVRSTHQQRTRDTRRRPRTAAAIRDDVRRGILTPQAARAELNASRTAGGHGTDFGRDRQLRLEVSVYGRAYSDAPYNEHMRRNNAATKIQAAQRGRSARVMVALIRAIHRSVVQRMRCWAHYEAMDDDERHVRDLAARRIQAWVASTFARWRVRAMLAQFRTHTTQRIHRESHAVRSATDVRRHERASLVIQAWMRGVRARRVFALMKALYKTSRDERVRVETYNLFSQSHTEVCRRAALRVQAFARGCVARRRFRERRAEYRRATRTRVAKEGLHIMKRERPEAYARAQRAARTMQGLVHISRARALVRGRRDQLRRANQKRVRKELHVAAVKKYGMRVSMELSEAPTSRQTPRVTIGAASYETTSVPSSRDSTAPVVSARATAKKSSLRKLPPNEARAATRIQAVYRMVTLRRRMATYRKDRLHAREARRLAELEALASDIPKETPQPQHDASSQPRPAVKEAFCSERVDDGIAAAEAHAEQGIEYAESEDMMSLVSVPPAPAPKTVPVVVAAMESVKMMHQTYDDFVAAQSRRCTKDTEAARRRMREKLAESETKRAMTREVAERNRREQMALDEAAEQRVLRKVLAAVEKDADAEADRIVAEETALRERKVELSHAHAGELAHLARRKILMAGEGFWPDEHSFSPQRTQKYSVWTNKPPAGQLSPKSPESPAQELSPSSAFRRRWVRDSLSTCAPDEAAVAGVEEALRRTYAPSDKVVVGPLVFTGRTLNEMRESLARREAVMHRPQPPAAARPTTSPARPVGRMAVR